MSLLVVGSVALDTIDTPLGRAENALGGSAVYVAVAGSYLASPVRIVGVVGGDFPSEAIEFLRRRSIDLEGLEVVRDGKTFRWGGKYHSDLNVRDTLYTDLNVFEHFDPKIPPAYRKSDYVCLGNIDPVLQQKVLQQIDSPKLVVCDTMNYWIERKYQDLLDTLRLIDVLIVNDEEARGIAREANVLKSARCILDMGPRAVVVKKGEHGALLVTKTMVFTAPGYPLEEVHDPTGAGDAFAGGFTGYLAKTENLSDDSLKRALVYGSVLASFCIEKFSLAGLEGLTESQLSARVKEFQKLSHFDGV
ncbi:MAG: PfkB family carbohydrate kinase [Bacteroidota bacterium]